MQDEEIPNIRDVWDQLTQARLELAELKGMLNMHFKEAGHHHPPCKCVTELQKSMLSAVGAALLALMAAAASIIAEFVGR